MAKDKRPGVAAVFTALYPDEDKERLDLDLSFWAQMTGELPKSRIIRDNSWKMEPGRDRSHLSQNLKIALHLT